MPIEQEELDETLKGLLKDNEEIKQLLKQLIGKGGVSVPVSNSNQPSSLPGQSQLPEQSQSRQPTSTPQKDSTESAESESEEEKAWKKFFDSNGIKNPSEQESWKTVTKLTPKQAQRAFENGWRDFYTHDLTKVISHVSSRKGDIETSGDGDNKIETTNVNVLEHDRKNLDTVHAYLRDVKNAKELSNLPSYEKLKETYEEGLVPGSRSYKKVMEEVEKKAKELFEKNFGSDHGLTSDKIDAWRTTKTTGLGGEGSNERKAFDNDWTEPAEIKEGKINYRNEDFDVLSFNKTQLDNALDILLDINSKTSRHDCPEDKWEARINELVDKQLPDRYQQKSIKEARKKKFDSFTYSLTDVRDTGDIDEEEYRKILEKKNPVSKQKFKAVLTTKIVNELLKDYRSAIRKEGTAKEVDRDLENYLTGQENIQRDKKKPAEYVKGYRIDNEKGLSIKVEGKEETWEGKDIVDQENKWIKNKEKDKQSKLLLPFFYAKNNFDPDNLTKDSFCAFEPKKESAAAKPAKQIKKESKVAKPAKQLKEVDGAWQGALAIGTGVGKTTKTASCLCKGGKRNIVLVTPTEGLAYSAGGHHADWLQKDKKTGVPYKCVYHGEEHGEYPVAVNKLTQWKVGEGKNARVEGKAGVSCLWYPVFLNYMARELLDVKKIKINGDREEYDSIQQGLKDAKAEMIPDDTILIFDEAHFNKSDYQQTFRETVFLESKKDKTESAKEVLLMSATFRGKAFSITSSYPITSQRILEFEPSLDAKLAKSQTLLFLKNSELSEAHKALLKDIPYVIFNEANFSAAEGISYGMPEGGLMIVNSDFRMGYTFKCQIVIDCGMEETEVVQGGWKKGLITQEYSVANLTQGRGRVGRTEEGWYYTISTKTEDAGAKPNLLSAMVQAIFGDPTSLQKTFFRSYDGDKLVECIRAAFAFKDKWGRAPESLLIGFDPYMLDGQNFPQWLTQEKYDEKKKDYDEKLWKKYLGTYKPPVMGQEQAKQVLFLMIQTHLNNEKDIIQQIKVGFDSPLFRQAGLKKKGEEGYEDSIAEIQSVLNGVINDKLNDLGHVNDKKVYNSNEAEIFEKVLSLLKIVKDVNIEIVEKDGDEEKKEGDKEKDLLLTINYPKVTKEEAGLAKKFLGGPEAWECSKCEMTSWEGVTCRVCGWWKEANSHKQEIDINQSQILVETY